MKNQILKFKNLLNNLKILLSIAWQMDKFVVFNYYFTAAVGSIIPIGAGIVMKYLIDSLQINLDAPLVQTIPLILIFILATKYVMTLAEDVVKYGLNETYFDYLLRYKLQNEFCAKFINKVTQLDLAHLENPEIQNLLFKTRDTIGWRPPDFLRYFRYFFESLVGFLGAFIILISFSLWIPLIITLVSLPRLILRLKYGTLEWSVWDKMGSESRMRWYLMYLFTETPTIREMKVFQTQNSLVKKFIGIQNHLLDLQKEPLDKYLKFLVLPSFIETVIMFAVVTFFVPDVLKGIISIGSFTLIISMVDRLNQTASGIVGSFAGFYEHNLYVQYFLDCLALPKLITEPENAVELDLSKPPSIEFKNVSFKYTDKLILHNINFIVNPGERIAFVGPNGAGKSTIIKLICRFYDVTEGEILINGVNLKNIKLSNWYKFIGTLFQDFVKYQFTVKENIELSSENINSMQKVKKAAKQADAADFIDQLKGKYDQILGREFEEGEELSIGQWQKIAIARAFYEAAPVLILDEPTSAIDAEAEYQIFNNLEKHYKGKSLIFVSHRFSTVRNADRIYVIDQGRIIEEGTHQELINKKGKYASMFNIQAQGYRN